MKHPRRPRTCNPHRRLVAAVLVSAVKALRSHKTDVKDDAVAWLSSPLAEGWLHLLSFEPPAFREALRKQGLLP